MTNSSVYEAAGVLMAAVHLTDIEVSRMTILTKEATVGSKSLVGIRPGPYPLSFGNYFCLGDGTRVLNFWAENLEEARTRFLPDGRVEVREWEWISPNVGSMRACIVFDPRIPYDWYYNKLCFTGFGRPPEKVVREIYALLGDPDNELEFYDDPELYHARRGQRVTAHGSVTYSSSDTPSQLVAEILAKRGQPNIVHTQEVDGKTYTIELLNPPVIRGAGLRTHRLRVNGVPASGRQYHYGLEGALKSIEFLVQYTHHQQLAALNTRVTQLERANRLANTKIETGEFEGLRGNDIWAEIKELVRMNLLALSDAEIEAQAKRVRVMLLQLDAKAHPK